MIRKAYDLKDNEWVFVNGKRVAAELVELDVEDSWVKVLIPKVVPIDTASDVSEIFNSGNSDDDLQKIGYEEKTLTGKVEIRELNVNSTPRN